MLPSQRRAELSKQYFDNSYLSRKAFESDVIRLQPEVGSVEHYHLHAEQQQRRQQQLQQQQQQQVLLLQQQQEQLHQQHHHHHHHQQQQQRGVGGARSPPGTRDSLASHATSGLTTYDEELDPGGDSYGSNQYRTSGRRQLGGAPGVFASGSTRMPEDDSDYSDHDSLDSEGLGDPSDPPGKFFGAGEGAEGGGGIQYANSMAGQIWSMLDRMEDVILAVKANKCQCERLGARLAALKRPMVAVQKGRKSADHEVLATIKELVMESQLFMQSFLDADWWMKGAARKDDAEMFRELTFRLGFLMQAPPGFQEQSQEEDRADRLQDYADLHTTLEGKLREARERRTANDIKQVLRTIRDRAAAEGAGVFAEINIESLEFAHDRPTSIGNGGFGTVLTATIETASMGNSRNDPMLEDVVVKRLNNQDLRVRLLEDLRREVEIHHGLQYDFVVKTLGACTGPPNCSIVQERAPSSLFELLHNKADSRSAIPIDEKAAMLYDVARGLQFLHIKGVVHGNIKSTNVLVFENNRLKVSDFGLISVREAQGVMGGGETAHSAAWTAPEVLDDQGPSILSDVYSFGILVHEVLTQRVPFAGKSVAKIISAVFAKGHRPGYLPNEEAALPVGLVKLANLCWAQDPEVRPNSLNAVVTELLHIVNALGGDPRSQPYEETAEEQGKTNRGASPPTSDALTTDADRRIKELEEELRALKTCRKGGGDEEGTDEFGPQLSAGSSEEITMWSADSSKNSNCAAPIAPFSYRHGAGKEEEVRGEKTVGLPQGLPAERTALRALYTATQGPGWFNGEGWESNEPDFCTWFGVTCDANGHVTELKLASNNLRGQLPRELTRLSKLKILVLYDNFMEGPIPKEFGDFDGLIELDLSMNDLTGAIPADLSKAKSLERLYVQCNALSGNTPRSMKKLPKLKVFVADWSVLSDTHAFKTFRKASPPVTPAEIARAKSSARTEARVRARKFLQAAASQRQQQLQQQLKQERPQTAFDDSSVGSGSASPSASSSAQVTATPLRSKSLGAGGRAQPATVDYHGSLGAGVVGESSSGYSETGSSGQWAVRGGGEFYDDFHRSSYPAPTAPYMGEDGPLGKAARAKVPSSTATHNSKVSKKKFSAMKFFKEVVGADLHPGFTDTTTGSELKSRKKGDVDADDENT